jgi:hemerythrin-like metal-binding protein
MPMLDWNDVFVTGIRLVDEQHRGLVALINRAAPRLAVEGADPDELAGLYEQLTDYAAHHFACEEGLMREAGLAAEHCERHAADHREFVEDLNRWHEQLGRPGGVSGRDLLRFLTHWLVLHILGEDQEMARQIALIDRGVPAGEALIRARHTDRSAAERLLGETLTDFFALLSQRNRTLIALNQALESARAALQAANAGLEVRVAERTAGLDAANQALQREQAELRRSLEQLAQTQAQLLQSEKMAAVGQLAAGVAHEINNPIGFVGSNLASLGKYVERLFALVDEVDKMLPSLPPEVAARLHGALERAELTFLREDIPDLLRESADGLARVRRIVADLKDFSHVDESDWQEADLNAGLESTLNVVWNELKYKARIERDFGVLPPVRCLPAQLNQVFMNLLVNSAQAIETQGTIRIRTRDEGGRVQIEIADTGKGIPPEIQSRIFEPFFTTKPVGQGTGLGLSISWDIVRRHGGRIAVESAPGKGSRFTITLPRDARQEVAA